MADKELDEYRKLWSDRSKRSDARERANQYVQANPDKFRAFDSKSIDQLVREVDKLRAAKDDDAVTLIEMYLVSQRPQQVITGSVG